MGRRLLGVFMTVYMPTILMNLIGHSTNYFSEMYFEATISVNLTASEDFKCQGNIFNSIHLIVGSEWDLCEGDAGVDNDVCEREQRAAEDELHEDGWLLARLQPLHPFRWGSASRLHGE